MPFLSLSLLYFYHPFFFPLAWLFLISILVFLSSYILFLLPFFPSPSSPRCVSPHSSVRSFLPFLPSQISLILQCSRLSVDVGPCSFFSVGRFVSQPCVQRSTRNYAASLFALMLAEQLGTNVIRATDIYIWYISHNPKVTNGSKKKGWGNF